MKRSLSLIHLLLLASIALQSAAETKRAVVTVSPQSVLDGSHDYFIGLLQLALDKANDLLEPVEIEFYGEPLTQERAFIELANGEALHVYWSGASQKREEVVIAIPIPLLKGLLGFRMPVIHAQSLERWRTIESLESLREFSACQGSVWPDSDILEAAGLPVERVFAFEQMYLMLHAGRCDYFPRAISEVFAELEQVNQVIPDLVAVEDLIIHYPFPMYFFVTPTQPDLAERIREGLEKLIDSGEFDQYLQTHPATKRVFPFSQWQGARIISLSNPLLPVTAQPENPRYWINP